MTSYRQGSRRQNSDLRQGGFQGCAAGQMMADVRVQAGLLDLTRDDGSQGSAKLGAGDEGTVIGGVREYVYCDGCLGRRLLREAWMAGSDGMWCCGVLALHGRRQRGSGLAGCARSAAPSATTRTQ